LSKKPNKTKKTPLGWAFFKKTRVFEPWLETGPRATIHSGKFTVEDRVSLELANLEFG